MIASLALAALFAAVLLGALAAGLALLVAVTLWLVGFGIGVAVRLVWGMARRDGSLRPGSTGRPPMGWSAFSQTVLVSVTMRASARLAGLDRDRSRHLTGSRIPVVPWPCPVPGLAPRERQRAWLESPVVRRGVLYQLARLPFIVAVVTAVSGVVALMVACFARTLWPGGYAVHSASVPIGAAALFLWLAMARAGFGA